ncbi:hypothetical protein [Thalassolituus maritimus]|jgi:hypothetical protein|uniref:Uncharacterized protein n=1 Tax=Thalassolituus maritimus TaxID=484498 RepID=A0ABP9ZZL0_9GAMM|nr:hypothetical protein [Pseudomonadota bacterium]MEC8523409.1 hypothetical protein [Pseudomonadota bacterium]|tara:strand:+ start:466 stop:705 length:240 start_codon:yes stop_codon:yes gene_type:complete
MKHRNNEEHRIEHRLRKIEAQLHDILLVLEQRSSQEGEEADQALIREALRDLQSNQQDIALNLFAMKAANDPDGASGSD